MMKFNIVVKSRAYVSDLRFRLPVEKIITAHHIKEAIKFTRLGTQATSKMNDDDEVVPVFSSDKW